MTSLSDEWEEGRRSSRERIFKKLTSLQDYREKKEPSVREGKVSPLDGLIVAEGAKKRRRKEKKKEKNRNETRIRNVRASRKKRKEEKVR